MSGVRMALNFQEIDDISLKSTNTKALTEKSNMEDYSWLTH